jgi:hypothetical protein
MEVAAVGPTWFFVRKHSIKQRSALWSGDFRGAEAVTRLRICT